MAPSDVLAVLVEAWVGRTRVPWQLGQILADVLEDHGRTQEAWLLRQHEREAFIGVDVEGQWQIQELVLLPRAMRKAAVKVWVEKTPASYRASASAE